MASTLERHDKYNFEAKIDYELDLSSRKNKYKLTFYFFIPKSLKISSRTYTPTQFYTDFYTYLRFRVPRFTLSGLFYQRNELSPFNKIHDALAALKTSPIPPATEKRIIYELRMLVSILKSAIKFEVYSLITGIRKKTDSGDTTREAIRSFLDLVLSLDKKLDDLESSIKAAAPSEELLETMGFARYYIGLKLQIHLSALLHVCQASPDKDVKKSEAELIRIIEQKTALHPSKGIFLERKAGSDNETFTYWEGILKKYFQGVLYLEIWDRKTHERAAHILYAFAAGAAMFLSLLLGFWIGGNFSNQQSMGFILALVAAYIIKDRTKEIIRSYSNRVLRFFFLDRKRDIIDPLMETGIGEVSEHVRFISRGEVPAEVIQRRTADHATVIEDRGKPEEVLVYEKKVVLETEKIKKLHSRHRDLSDIMRFNVRNFIMYTDDPYHIERVWHAPSKKIRRIKCAKVYHLNIIIRLEDLSEAGKKAHVSLKHVRIILNQKGIVRMEESPQTAPDRG